MITLDQQQQTTAVGPDSQQCRFVSTSEISFEFDGYLMAEHTGSVERESQGEYTYLLQCYHVITDGSYVVAIALANPKTKLDLLLVDAVDSFDEIESFYFVHQFSDLWVELNQKPPVEEGQKRLASALDGLYFSLVVPFVQEVRRRIEIDVARAKVKPLDSGRKPNVFSRIMGFVSGS